MGTNVNFSIHPDPREVRADIEQDGGYRCVDVGPVSIFISDRRVLDALHAALDEIRADMDAETAEVAS